MMRLRQGYRPGRGYVFPQGDPFLGALIGSIGASIVKGATKLLSGAGKKAAAAVVGGAGRLVRGGARALPKGSARRAAAAGGAGAIAGGLLFGGGGRQAAEPGFRRARMDVGNVKALRRSIRRVEGFAKLARKTISFTKTVKLKRRGKR